MIKTKKKLPHVRMDVTSYNTSSQCTPGFQQRLINSLFFLLFLHLFIPNINTQLFHVHFLSRIKSKLVEWFFDKLYKHILNKSNKKGTFDVTLSTIQNRTRLIAESSRRKMIYSYIIKHTYLYNLPDYCFKINTDELLFSLRQKLSLKKNIVLYNKTEILTCQPK